MSTGNTDAVLLASISSLLLSVSLFLSLLYLVRSLLSIQDHIRLGAFELVMTADIDTGKAPEISPTQIAFLDCIFIPAHHKHTADSTFTE